MPTPGFLKRQRSAGAGDDVPHSRRRHPSIASEMDTPVSEEPAFAPIPNASAGTQTTPANKTTFSLTMLMGTISSNGSPSILRSSCECLDLREHYSDGDDHRLISTISEVVFGTNKLFVLVI
jgi:hypothetical protein